MKILSVRHLDGPNIFIYKPILMARIDLEGMAERESYQFPGFSDRLLRTFPGLREHHCAKGEPGGFVERLYGGTYFGHIIEHLAIELACISGIDVHYGKTLYAGGLGVYDVVMECKEFATQRYLLEQAILVVGQLLRTETADIPTVLGEATRILTRTVLGPSTQAIVRAALQRNIPVRRINEGSLIQLGYGINRKLAEATITERTSAVAVDLASDKSLTKRVLSDAGIPVPEGGLATTVEEAIRIFEQLDGPVVVKPFNGNQGKGVSLDLRTAEEVKRAYDIAAQYAAKVLVERHIAGKNLRLLVVDGHLVAASERLPAHVVGDGVRSIQELIEAENENPLRGRGHEKPLTRIAVDAVVEQTLSRQGTRFGDVPDLGVQVILRESANLSTGGVAVDATDVLHSSYRRLAERTARVIGLDVCGIDMIVPCIEEPCQPGECAVIEVNAAPGIRMHHFPTAGDPRDAGRAIVESLYPDGTSARIPVISVTGTNGKTTTTRLIGHGLSQAGKLVGMTTTGGVFVDGEKIQGGDTTGPDSARMVLADPAVEVAVLETARGGIVRGGLAYDKANVAVLTNLTLDHLGQDGVETMEDLLHIKSLVAECVQEDGVVVLNADDENLVQLSKRLKSRIIFFSQSDNNPVLRRHLAFGGVGYYIAKGWLVEGRGHLSWEIARIQDIPLTLGGHASFQVQNSLAAATALRALGLTRNQVAETLASFLPSRDNPGRCMIYRMQNGGHVVLDYGHNPDGFQKLGNWLKLTPHRRLIGVVGVPGDRSNHVVRESAQQLGRIFDYFFIKEDIDKRGRAEGEVAALLAEEIATRKSPQMYSIVLSETQALGHAVELMDPGDVVVLFYEQFQPAVSLIAQLGGELVSRIEAVSQVEPAGILATL